MTSTRRSAATSGPRSATKSTSSSTTARRASSTSSRFARYTRAQAGPRSTRSQGASRSTTEFAEAYYLLGLCQRDAAEPRDGAVAALERAVALQPALLQAREELADLYGRARPDRRPHSTQLEALACPRPRPSRDVALGLAYARAGQTDARSSTLGRAPRAVSRPCLHLRRARPRVARDRADRAAIASR